MENQLMYTDTNVSVANFSILTKVKKEHGQFQNQNWIDELDYFLKVYIVYPFFFSRINNLNPVSQIVSMQLSRIFLLLP